MRMVLLVAKDKEGSYILCIQMFGMLASQGRMEKIFKTFATFTYYNVEVWASHLWFPIKLPHT